MGKVKKGLAIGCGVLVVALFLIVGSAVFVLQRIGGDYREMRASQEELFAAHQDPETYTPAGGGLPTPERVALFVALRRDMAEWRGSTDLQLAEFLLRKQQSEESGGLAFYRLARSTGDLASHLARYWQARNEKLLDRGMGLGEYAYIYCLAYYAYLGYDPADGVQETDFQFDADQGPIIVSEDGPATEAERRDRAWAGVHDLIAPMLARAHEAASADTASVDPVWQEALAAEVALLDRSPLRYPWRDGAPRPLADLLRGYRRDLEELYDVALNPMELLFEEIPAGEAASEE